jgi:hypothetical protein
MRPVIAVAIAFAAGCYNPSVAPCELACAPGAAPCPSGLVCNGQQLCAESVSATCSDAAPADADPDAVVEPCPGWRPISNVDPCALDADGVTDDLVVSSLLTIDTDANAVPGFTVQVVSQGGMNASDLFVAMVHDLTISSTVTVNGSRPLVILASGSVTIEFGGVIDYSLSTPDPSQGATCVTNGGNGNGGTEFGGGGGGGGFGTAGADGGPGSQDPAAGGAGGAPDSNAALVPLRGGCAGGNGGGDGGGSMGGVGGLPGGGIQISAKETIAVNGFVSSGGGGGFNGTGFAGGGGGGSGGAILLEAATVTVNGSLCANGGGGAGGSQNTGVPAPGAVATCDVTPAPGGGPPLGTGSGGAGGARKVDPIAGIAGAAGSIGSGGGGGSVGRIRINGQFVFAFPTISPAETTGP